MNERSSRSHAIFSITVECSEKGLDGQHHVRMGKLHLVDLAVSTSIIIIMSPVLHVCDAGWYHFNHTQDMQNCH